MTSNLFVSSMRSLSSLVGSSRLTAAILFVASAAWAGPDSTSGGNYTDRITQAIIFRQPLVWVGETPPSEAESRALWEAFGFGKYHNVIEAKEDLEEFIREFPKSPWTPSLRALMAKEYLEIGRYTRALGHWEAAWEATKDLSGTGQMVADFALAHWTRLLGNLGRADKLHLLFEETRGRTLSDGPLQVMFNDTCQGMAALARHPESGAGCGGYALAQVAAGLKAPGTNQQAILAAPMPSLGYTLEDLAALGSQHGVELAPVAWTAGTPLTTPAVLHLRQNHYLAVLEYTQGRYRVVDRALGGSKWVPAETLDTEASGAVLVPANKVSGDARRLTPTEARAVLGKGWATFFDDPGNRPPCTKCPCPPGEPNGGGPGGGWGGGAGGPGGCPTCAPHPKALALSAVGAMPTWTVMEPFINLWVTDEPLAYQPVTGPRVAFEIFYKQRSERSFPTNSSGFQVFGVGPSWNCSWLAYAEPAATDPADVTLYVAGGGVAHFRADGATLEFGSDSRMTRTVVGTNTTAYTVVMPSGAREVYGFLRTNQYGQLANAFLTQKIDETGRTTTFNYATTTNTVVRLASVVDADGATSFVTYATSGFSTNSIVRVDDPYGHFITFSYNAQGYLTNAVDVYGFTNSFGYAADTNKWLTNITTAYGSTTFKHTDIPILSSGIERSVIVTEPDGGRQMFA